jgi:hypothetical protein
MILDVGDRIRRISLCEDDPIFADLPMLRPSPTLARKDCGSNDGPGSIAMARRPQPSADPAGSRFRELSYFTIGLSAGKVAAHFGEFCRLG